MSAVAIRNLPEETHRALKNAFPDPARRPCDFGGDEARTGAAVLSWLDAQAAETLFLSSVTVAELGFGVAALPEDRTLPFDLAASRRYGASAAQARAGRGFPTPDGFIAAIAASRNFMVATRDASPFVAAGLTVIDPWTIDP